MIYDNTVLVFLDKNYPGGRIESAHEPQLYATDVALNRGDGIFETMLALKGSDADVKTLTVRKQNEHLKRLESSAAKLDLTLFDLDTWQRAIATGISEYLYEAETIDEVMVKLVALKNDEETEPGTSWVSLSPVPESIKRQRQTGVRVLTLDRGYSSNIADSAPWLLLGAKTISYAVNMAALRYAHKNDADDVIFLSSDGYVLEGPTSSVLIKRTLNGHKELVTPPKEHGILPGTTQEAIFAAAEKAGWQTRVSPLRKEDLDMAEAIWLTSSARLVAPVTALDGQERDITTFEEVTEEFLSYLK